MASTTSARRLFVNPQQAQQADEVLEHLVGPGTLSVEHHGEHTFVVPESVGRLLQEVLQTVARGGTVTLSSVPDVLTTSAAASILGISRPTLMKMIDAGTIPSHRVGSHHRLKSKDVFAALRARRERERAAFEALLELEGDSE